MNIYLVYGLRECPIRIKAHRLSLEYSHVGHILLLDESSNVIACLNNSYTVIKEDTQSESLDKVSSLDLNEELSYMGVKKPIDINNI